MLLPPRCSFLLIASFSLSLLPPRHSILLVIPSSSLLLPLRLSFLFIAPSTLSLLPPRHSFLLVLFFTLLPPRTFLRAPSYILIISSTFHFEFLNTDKSITSQPTSNKAYMVYCIWYGIYGICVSMADNFSHQP